MKQKRRVSMSVVLAAATALILLLTVTVSVVIIRSGAKRTYLRSVRSQLQDALNRLQDASFGSDAVDEIRRDGIAVLLLDPEGRVIHDSGLELPGREPRDRGFRKEPMEDRRPARELPGRDLQELLDSRLGTADGTFFDTDASSGERLTVDLYGRESGYCFRISCMVLPLDSALELVLRNIVIVSAVVWLLCLIPLFALTGVLVRPAKEVAVTARKIAKQDFSVRCSPAKTKEMAEISESINEMSDALQADMTLLKESNEKLAEELAERQRQQMLNIELINNLSHDLKTPIAVISGYAEGLAGGLADTPERTAQYCGVILEETEMMQQIVTKLLRFGKAEVESPEPHPVVFDAAALLRSVFREYAPEIEKNGLSLTLCLPEKAQVFADPGRIRQVLVNYVQNSIHHINGGSAVRAELHDAEDGMTELAIANSSRPFSDRKLSDIWKRMYRGNPARTSERSEIGLGLSIVKANMEKSGLPYGVRNLLPDGMVEFYIRLPKEQQGDTDE